MPRYLFHLFNGQQTVDGDGKVLPDLEAALAVAVEGARALMADGIQTKGQIDLSHWIEIEDENGSRTVLKFRDAVTIRSVAP